MSDDDSGLTSMRQFLESVPPGTEVEIEKGLLASLRGRGDHFKYEMPDIEIHCPKCDGIRVFHCSNSDWYVSVDSFDHRTFEYECRNCRDSPKIFGLLSRGANGVHATKLGEHPPFGPPIPRRINKLVGDDKELFLRGYRSEKQGLGVGASAYYRRVVERQWQSLLDEVLRVAREIGSDPGVIATLEDAKNETQFARAVEKAKDAIPNELRLAGHNPLTLLYGTLSQLLHAGGDDEFLRLATDIRTILFSLAERAGQVLEDQRILKGAIGRIQKRP